MENNLSLTRDRQVKWQSNCNEEQLCSRQRVKRIFDMKTLVDIESHDQLWELMEQRPGWIRQENEGGKVDYLLISSRSRCFAKASLPSNLLSASPDVLQTFVNTVNKFEHADIFAVWETFKVCPLAVPSQKASVESHHDKIERSATSSHGFDVRLSSASVDIMSKKLYSG